MHQLVCSCQSPTSTTNGHTEQARVIAELHGALAGVLEVLRGKEWMPAEHQAAIWWAREVLKRSSLER